MNKAIIILPTDSIIFTSWIKSKIEKKFINSIFFFIDQHLHLSKREIIKKINQLILVSKAYIIEAQQQIIYLFLQKLAKKAS